MSWYLYACTGKTTWQPLLAEDLPVYIKDHNPEFTTVLECNQTWGKGETPPPGTAYRGPLYFDWDGEGTIQEVLDDVKRFMNKLEAKGFDLNQASWWLSGKKGVHCTIPAACFMGDKDLQNLNRAGHAYLPAIYRQMACDDQLITKYMDMRVYTGRKGRMWRTANRARNLDDGRTTYKVSIAPDQFRKLDEAGYWAWCTEPRPEVKPAPATKNPYLSMEFSRAATFVSEKFKERTKAKTVDFSDWQTLPPTIAAAFQGEGIQSALDLNSIKLQLCIAACAVGMGKLDDEDRFIQTVEGFINSRVGTEGAAHQTRDSIEQALRNCFRSVAQNPCYVYTAKGFASILTADRRQQSDLVGKPGSENKDQRIAKDAAEFAAGTYADSMGVVTVGKEEARAISNYTWQAGSMMLIKDELGQIQAHSIIPEVSGKAQSRTTLPLDVQLNSTKMTRHVMSVGGHLEMSSPQRMSQIRAAWKNYVGDNGDINEAPEAVAVRTEGMFIQMRADPDEKDYDNLMAVHWVEPSGVHSSVRNASKVEDGESLPVPLYVDHANPTGRFGTDLGKTKETLATTKTPMRDTIQALLELNGNTFSMAVMLGWFTACSLKHPLFHMKLIENFPILQVYGEAGCGKTTTMNLMLKMFTWKEHFRVSTAGDGLTQAAMRMMATGTTSIPFVIDEVKVQNLGNGKWMADFRQMLQNMYTIGGELRKAGGRSEGSHHNEMVDAPMFAPVAFLGETLETSQTSLMERIVPAGFHGADKNGRWAYADHLQYNSRSLSVLGWTLVQEVMEGSMDDLAKLYLTNKKLCFSRLYSGSNDRITQNATMVLTGFDFFAAVLEKYFPGVFSSKLEAMRSAILDESRWGRTVASEVVRLLSFMAQGSHEPSEKHYTVQRDFHYYFVQGDSPEGQIEYLVVSAPRLFFTYRERMRAIGETAVYSSAEEMYHALRNSNLAVDSFDDKQLGPLCVQFPVPEMVRQGIQRFK